MPAEPVPRIPIALTMGEPAGIGGEIALLAWRRRQAARLPPFFLLDDPARLAALARRIGTDVPLQAIGAAAEAAAVFDRALPVLPLAVPKAVAPGQPDAANAAAVLGAIERAVTLCRSGAASAMVTNPIHKGALYAAGFRHPGHTEYLAALLGGVTPVMLLAGQGLRVVPVTVHLALRDALARLDTTLIIETALITAAALERDFGIRKPRLAVAGLNPHAGEGGALGREDVEIIAPALAELQRRGIAARGPLSADTLFHPKARAGYDVALCMYHDQALIPLKTLDFDGGVNVTLGLPIVRTSPDHGTAFDIAGSGQADPRSMIAALQVAAHAASKQRGRLARV